MIPINSWNSELEVSLKQLEHIWICVFESRCMDWIEQELGKLLDRLGIRKVHVVKTFRHGESVPRSQLFPKQRETKGSVGMLSFWMVWTFRLFWLVQLNWVTKVIEEYGYPATGLKLECFPPHLDNFTIALGASVCTRRLGSFFPRKVPCATLGSSICWKDLTRAWSMWSALG